MRILVIRLENINSLKGKHTFPFAEGAIADAGIVAIIGKTGAGKSTVFDAVPLALFNYVPRLGKISGEVISEKGVVVSRHCDHASAEVEYESNGKIYRSTWSVKRKRTEGFQACKMQVAEVLPDGTGKIISSALSEVPKVNEELIGLSYEQLEKSMMLSQGAFARFLTAKKNERSALLEQLTGTEIFRQVGKRAYERAGRCASEIEQAERELDKIQLLSEEEVASCHQNILQKNKLARRLNHKKKRRESLVLVKRRIQDLQQKIADSDEALSKLLAEDETFRPLQQKLTDHHRALPLHAEVTHLQLKRNEVEKTKQKISAALVEREKASQQKITALNDFQEKAAKQITEEDFQQALRDLQNQIDKIDLEIAALEGARKEDGANLLRLKKVMQDDYPSEIATTDKKEALVLQLIEQVEAEITSLSLPEECTSENTAAVQAQLEERKQQLMKISTLRVDLERHTKAVSSTTEVKIEKEQARDIFRKDVVQKSNELELAKKEKEALQNLHAAQMQVMSMKELREKLVEGEPCFLCGSTTHPYSSGTMIKPVDDVLKGKTTEIQLLEKEFQKLNLQLTALETEIAVHESTIKHSAAEVDSIDKAIKELLTLTAFTGDENISLSVAGIENDLEALGRFSSLLQKKRHLLELKEICHKAEKAAARLSDLREERKRSYKGTDFRKDMEKWQTSFLNASTAFEIAEKNIKADSAALQSLTAEVASIEEKVNEKINACGFKSEADVLEVVLTTEEAEEIETMGKRIRDNIVRVRETLHVLMSQLTQEQAQDVPRINLDQLLSFIKSAESDTGGLINEVAAIRAALTHNQSQAARAQEIKSQLESYRREAWKWEMINQLIGDSTGNKFCNIVQKITLRHLFLHANNRLRELSDRYVLLADEENDDILISDEYMAGAIRTVASLSGGETFLVSIALALGLSDLASQNVKLDTLFIDEGFATLDPESLDVALNTLEKLQSENNKTIAVISHVEALKERIGCQIRIHKSASGFSTVELPVQV